MSSADFDTVIIGAGFAGLSVAHALGPQGVAVLDRGEPLDVATAASQIDAQRHSLPSSVPMGHLGAMQDLVTRLTASRLEQNQVTLPLSMMCKNILTQVQGGNSNLWGGFAARITPETFAQDGVLAWPLGHEELKPYYEHAERLLHVHGDPHDAGHTVVGALPGWDHWRDYFRGLFPQAHVTPLAKNITNRDAGPLGLCQGNGHCKLCPNDAKARPANVFPNVEVVGGSRVDRIVFDGARAVAVAGSASGESFEVSFNRLVVASGGLENVALLHRSGLPGSLLSRVGRHYQDHTACRILAVLPQRIRHFHLGAEGGVVVPELSGYMEGIEVKTVMLPVTPTAEQIAHLAHCAGTSAAAVLQLSGDALDHIATFYLQMEVPPEWDLELRTRDHQAFIHTMPYLRHVPLLDAVVLQVAQRMEAAGVRVAAVEPHHRYAFGGHHYSGTTPMSRNERRVVDNNLRLIGTDNVYINGGSVIPRCGGSGPTLTIAALGLRLGEHLARSHE